MEDQRASEEARRANLSLEQLLIENRIRSEESNRRLEKIQENLRRIAERNRRPQRPAWWPFAR